MICPICKTEARVEKALETEAGRYVEYCCRNKRCEKHGKAIGRKGTAPDAEAAPIIHHFEGKEDEQE